MGTISDTRDALVTALETAVTATPRIRVQSTPRKPGAGTRYQATVTVGPMSIGSPPDMFESSLTVDIGSLADSEDAYQALDDLLNTLEAGLPVNWVTPRWQITHDDTLRAFADLEGFAAPASDSVVIMEDTTATMEDTGYTMEGVAA